MEKALTELTRKELKDRLTRMRNDYAIECELHKQEKEFLELVRERWEREPERREQLEHYDNIYRWNLHALRLKAEMIVEVVDELCRRNARWNVIRAFFSMKALEV